MRRGGEKRGNTRNRRSRKLWLLASFDPDLGPTQARCALMVDERCRGILDYATVTADRIVPGGSYRREGLRPACAPCQSYQGHLVSTGQWVAS